MKPASTPALALERRQLGIRERAALRYNRTDTSLVRVVVPIEKGQQDAATKTGVEFIQAFFGTLRQYFPA